MQEQAWQNAKWTSWSVSFPPCPGCNNDISAVSGQGKPFTIVVTVYPTVILQPLSVTIVIIL